MQTLQSGLQVGDIVDVMYLRSGFGGWAGQRHGRWLRAEIIHCEADAWPIALLKDGQWTEIRPFMTWRLIARAPKSDRERVAA